MPRRPRLHVPGGLYHVTLRGNHQQAIFRGDSDRQLLERLLAEVLSRYHYRVHAYCWMTNHIHLAVEVAEVSLGRFMQVVSSRFARAVQRHVPTTGHLFERRYGAILVEADAYLLQLVRYIHLNPVRAALLPDPLDYRWSSHRAYLGFMEVSWLTTAAVLGMFGDDIGSAREAYRRFISEDVDPAEAAQFRHGGPDDQRVLGQAISPCGSGPQPHDQNLEEIVAKIAADLTVSVAALATPSRARHLSQARAVIARTALNSGAATLTEIAARFNRTPATIWAGMRRYDDDLPENASD